VELLPSSTDDVKRRLESRPHLLEPFHTMLRRIASGQVLTEHVWSLLLDVRGVPLPRRP
jgi:hypothetical protein